MYTLKEKSLIEFNINGEKITSAVRPADTLLYVLRNEMGLLGTKNACENGDCGTCTVLMDGWPVKSCILLAVEAVGHNIITIEGIKDTPIQSAFMEKFAYQCGYCTPGFIVVCHSLLNKHPDADDDTIKEWLESNICRCTGYEEIKQAVKKVIGLNV